jgi:hypothetical protein
MIADIRPRENWAYAIGARPEFQFSNSLFSTTIPTCTPCATHPALNKVSSTVSAAPSAKIPSAS